MEALDGLRGLAALSVVAFHVWLYTTADSGNPATLVDHVLRQAYLGLVLFFVLSGYLLFRPWLRAGLEPGRAAPDLGRYLRSRLARIAPAYYVALAGALVLAVTAGGSRMPPLEQLPLFLVFAQNWSPATLMTVDPPTWTLAIEISFYAALPLIGLAAKRIGASRRGQLALVLTLIAAGLAYRWGTLTLPADHPLRWSLPAYIEYFACGMLAAVLLHGRRFGRAAGGVLLVAGGVLVVANGVIHATVHNSEAAATALDLPAALGFAAIIGVAGHSRARRRILASRPLDALGRVSYGLYLWHLPVILWMKAHGLFPDALVPALAASLVPALAAASASWLLVEKPALKLLRGHRPEPALRRAGPARLPGSPSPSGPAGRQALPRDLARAA